jgi:diguanylate cyclase (GGDEF)-like protein/PAS domain S-box-containing protein
VFALALIAFAALVWFSFRESRDLSENNRWVSQTRDVLESSESLAARVTDAAAARGAYIRLGDPAQFEKFEAASNFALRDIAQLRNLTVDHPGQQLRIAQLDPLVRSRLALLRTAMESHQRISNDRTVQDAFTAQGAIISSQLLEMIRVFQGVERSLLQVRSAEAEASNSRANKINMIRTVFVFLSLLLVFWFLNREFGRHERAERAMIEQKRLLQSILDSCSDSVIVADSSGSIILRNPVAARENAVIHADNLNENYPEMLGLYKDDGQTLYKTEELALARSLRGEFVNGLEMCSRPPDGGQIRWKLAAGGPLLNAQGQKQGGVVFVRDITDRKEADRQLSKALQDAECHARENIELSELGDLLQSCHTSQEAYKMSENALAQIFGSRPGALCIINPSRDLVEARAVWNNCATTEFGFSPDDCWGLRRGKPYGESSSGKPVACSHLRGGQIGDYLCVPLMAHGETLGVMYLEKGPHAEGPLSDGEQVQQARLKRLALAVAERVSLALANLRLREMLRNQSIRDPLTGLYNRRYLEESLNRELRRAMRAKRPVSVVMLDLDNFKHFNDTFGHQAGDLLLKEVASLLGTRLRAGDLACRFGGEEFSLVLCEADIEGTLTCVRNICEAVRHLSVEYRGQTLGRITISAGIANYPAHYDNLEDLIHAADKALYTAKNNGRDCVVIYDGRETAAKQAPSSIAY